VDEMAHYTDLREYDFCRHVNRHPNLVSIYHMFVDTDTGECNMIMESVDMDLLNFIQSRNTAKISATTIKSIMYQALCGVAHIHDNMFMHRDLKPENILITFKHPKLGYRIKICDFGLSERICQERQLTSYVATRWYRAPELLLRYPTYTPAIDIWALAVVIVELANGDALFPGESERDQMRRLFSVLGSSSPMSLGGPWKYLEDNQEYLFPSYDGKQASQIFHHVHHLELFKLVSLCLKWDASRRPTAASMINLPIFDSIRHPATSSLQQHNTNRSTNYCEESLWLSADPDDVSEKENRPDSTRSPIKLLPRKGYHSSSSLEGCFLSQFGA
jgi:meiosis induction protein kinase IME2/SME1